MSVFEYAIICAANQMHPTERGYETAQRWAAQVIECVAIREAAAKRACPLRSSVLA